MLYSVLVLIISNLVITGCLGGTTVAPIIQLSNTTINATDKPPATIVVPNSKYNVSFDNFLKTLEVFQNVSRGGYGKIIYSFSGSDDEGYRSEFKAEEPAVHQIHPTLQTTTQTPTTPRPTRALPSWIFETNHTHYQHSKSKSQRLQWPYWTVPFVLINAICARQF